MALLDTLGVWVIDQNEGRCHPGGGTQSWHLVKSPSWFSRDLSDFFWKMSKMSDFRVFEHFWTGRSTFASLRQGKSEEVSKSAKIDIFDIFGWKSLKSDNFDFFRNWGFIEKNEGVILREGGYSKLTWYCHSKSPASPTAPPPIVLFSLYFLFCKFYNKCGYTTGSFWKFCKRFSCSTTTTTTTTMSSSRSSSSSITNS